MVVVVVVVVVAVVVAMVKRWKIPVKSEGMPEIENPGQK